jgi:hypothetical protein
MKAMKLMKLRGMTKVDKNEIAEIAGIEIIGKIEKIDAIHIKVGNLVNVMEDFSIKDIDLNRIDLEKAIEMLICRERTYLATLGVTGATNKAKVAIKRRCYKEKDYSAAEGNYWRANGWFERMETLK